MKTKIEIQNDSNWSVILTPENETEKAIVHALCAGYDVEVSSTKDDTTDDLMYIKLVLKSKEKTYATHIDGFQTNDIPVSIGKSK